MQSQPINRANTERSTVDPNDPFRLRRVPSGIILNAFNQSVVMRTNGEKDVAFDSVNTVPNNPPIQADNVNAPSKEAEQAENNEQAETGSTSQGFFFCILSAIRQYVAKTYSEAIQEMKDEERVMFYKVDDTSLLEPELIETLPLEILPLLYGFCEHRLVMLTHSAKDKIHQRMLEIHNAINNLILIQNEHNYHNACIALSDALMFYRDALITYSAFSQHIDPNVPVKEPINTNNAWPETGMRALFNRVISVYQGYRELYQRVMASWRGENDPFEQQEEEVHPEQKAELPPVYQVITSFEEQLQLLNDVILAYEQDYQVAFFMPASLEELNNLRTKTALEKEAFVQAQLDEAGDASALLGLDESKLMRGIFHTLSIVENSMEKENMEMSIIHQSDIEKWIEKNATTFQYLYSILSFGDSYKTVLQKLYDSSDRPTTKAQNTAMYRAASMTATNSTATNGNA